MLDSAKDLNDLRVPPGNRLGKLGGDRRGQYSIGSTASGESAFAGETMALGTSKSSTTIEERA
jgi:proteic killer suppression protein